MDENKIKILNANDFDFGTPINLHMTDTVMEWEVLTFVIDYMAANSIWQNVSAATTTGLLAPWNEFK